MQQDRALTDRQHQFVIEYCVHGNAAEAARVAGYSAQIARQSAYKLLLKPHIAAEIRRHAATLVDAHIPSAVATLAQLMTDPEVEPRDRIRAAEGLLRHVRPGGGSAVAVQVNVGTRAADAQAVIAEIWAAKQARETREGGSVIQGPAGFPSPIPPPSNARATFQPSSGESAAMPNGTAEPGTGVRGDAGTIEAWREAVRLALLGARNDCR